MFNGYEFSFAGVSSSEYGLYLCDIGNRRHSDVSFGNTANIVETRIAQRITPLHYGVRYHDSPLSFTLIFGSDRELDRYDLQKISKWLTGYDDYQWLKIDQWDLAKVMFRCLIKTLTPITVGWAPYAFQADIVCDCPYAYGLPFEETITFSGTDEAPGTTTFYNDGTARAAFRPTLTIVPTSTTFSIKNETTGDELAFTDLPSSVTSLTVDLENCIVSETASAGDGVNLYPYFNFGFLSFDPGDNELSFVGSGEVTISGRFLYNTGA